MSRVRAVLPVTLVLLVAGCTENTAPGNDREAELSPPQAPAEVAEARAATEGVATEMIIPQVMTDADLANVPDVGDRCVFRFTRVGLPVFVFGSAGVVKLNGKLVALPAAGGGGRGADVRRYAADPVAVAVRPLTGATLDDTAPDEGPVSAELVLQLAGAAHDLGYHGYAECEGRGEPGQQP